MVRLLGCLRPPPRTSEVVALTDRLPIEPEATVAELQPATPAGEGGASADDGILGVPCVTLPCETLLGEGTSGKVRSVASVAVVDGQGYALKTVELGGNGADAQLALAECRLHAALPPCGSIVRYHFAWLEPTREAPARLHILLERVDCELWDVISAGTARDTAECLRWSRQLLAALAILHAEGVAHRDVSPWNCFLAAGRHRWRSLKLGDFGLAAMLPMRADGSLDPLLYGSGPPLDESALGSLYSAPELLKYSRAIRCIMQRHPELV